MTPEERAQMIVCVEDLDYAFILDQLYQTRAEGHEKGSANLEIDRLKADLEEARLIERKNTESWKQDRNAWKAKAERLAEALEKIVELNEHPKSCRLGNENVGHTCDCGISIAKEALSAFEKGDL